MALKPMPAQSELAAALDYDPTSGELWWRLAPQGFRYDSRVRADRRNRGVGRYVMFNGERFSAARVAWVLVHGLLAPERIVRFKDGDNQNLRLDNLTLQGKSERLRGVRPLYEHTAKGWRVSAVVHGRAWPIGVYETKGEAVIAFSKQEERY